MDTARELIAKMVNGQLSSVELVKHCISVIDQTDDAIKAWAHVDREGALEQAAAMDLRRTASLLASRILLIPPQCQLKEAR